MPSSWDVGGSCPSALSPSMGRQGNQKTHSGWNEGWASGFEVEGKALVPAHTHTHTHRRTPTTRTSPGHFLLSGRTGTRTAAVLAGASSQQTLHAVGPCVSGRARQTVSTASVPCTPSGPCQLPTAGGSSGRKRAAAALARPPAKQLPKSPQPAACKAKQLQPRKAQF